MKINCISCGHKIDLGDAYDDYEGQVKCCVCASALEIQTVEGSVKSVRATRGTGIPLCRETATDQSSIGIIDNR